MSRDTKAQLKQINEDLLHVAHSDALSLHAWVHDLANSHLQSRQQSILKTLETAIAEAIGSQSINKNIH